VDLGPYLRAHSYLRVERPFTLWHADVDDVALIRLTGELLASALARGTALPDVVLRASNVTVTDDQGVLPVGDHVAITVEGVGDWSPEVSWTPDHTEIVLLNTDVTAAARAASVLWAYTRAFESGGSITVLFSRSTSS
jgi:hypothetical protein